MDRGASPEGASPEPAEEHPPLLFDGPDPDPPTPPTRSSEPVLLFREPEPNPLVRGVVDRVRSASARGVLLTRGRRWNPLTRVRPGWTWSSAAPTAVAGEISYLTWIVAGICGAIWSVVGLVFWLPVLVGGVAHFAVAHLQAMLEGRVPVAAGSRLRSAVSFYRRGFESALDIARGAGSEPSASSGGPRRGAEPLDHGRLLRAAGWALLAWYPVLMIVGVVEWPHVELQNRLLGGPWGDLPGVLHSGIAAAVGDVLYGAARIPGLPIR